MPWYPHHELNHLKFRGAFLEDFPLCPLCSIQGFVAQIELFQGALVDFLKTIGLGLCNCRKLVTSGFWAAQCSVKKNFLEIGSRLRTLLIKVHKTALSEFLKPHGMCASQDFGGSKCVLNFSFRAGAQNFWTMASDLYTTSESTTFARSFIFWNSFLGRILKKLSQNRHRNVRDRIA